VVGGIKLLKCIPTFYGTRKVHYHVHKSSTLVSWTKWIQFTTSHYICLKSILILSFYLYQSHPSGLFPSGFRTKHLYACQVRVMFRPWVYKANAIWREFKLWSALLHRFLQPLLTSSAEVQIFSWTPCSQAPPVYEYVPPSERLIVRLIHLS
jgi:hypothetical protein